MRFTGKLKEPIIDFVTHRLTILFEPNEDFLEAYEELKGKEVLSLEIKPYRKKRRLIDGLITSCKEAGLAASEIATPDEKRLLKERYGVDIG